MHLYLNMYICSLCKEHLPCFMGLICIFHLPLYLIQKFHIFPQHTVIIHVIVSYSDRLELGETVPYPDRELCSAFCSLLGVSRCPSTGSFISAIPWGGRWQGIASPQSVPARKARLGLCSNCHVSCQAPSPLLCAHVPCCFSCSTNVQWGLFRKRE